MSGDKDTGARLGEGRRRLVAENIGLVSVHLRRHVQDLSVPRRDREWEDLFQEGCLGLIQAAMSFRAERGIPFAAFALPRIHNAVSRALQTRFSTVHVPPKRRRARDTGQPEREARPHSTERRRPRVRSLAHDADSRLEDRRRREPWGDPARSDAYSSCDTIGQRLRGKYERAVRSACETMSRKTSIRGDRDKLVRILVEERLLVPHEESRRALRQIARDTRSSYARVAQSERGLGDAIRQALQRDPEFVELRRVARTDPNGTDLPIEDDIERRLAAASADAFVRRFHQADMMQRAEMFDTLAGLIHYSIDDIAREGIPHLSSREREQLLR